MKTSPSARIGFFLFAVTVMTVVFATFYFRESPWATPAFQSDSEALVTRKIEARISILDDLKLKGGFLYADAGNVSTLIPGLYTSQVGLQGLVLNILEKASGAEANAFIGGSRIVMSALFALTLLILLQVAWAEFGFVTAFVLLIQVVLSSWLVAFSKNLYWVAFTMFLPYALGWLIYPRVIEERITFRTYLVVISALVLLKSLNGYEYITNVILGATVAPVYFEIRSRSGWLPLLKKMGWIGAAGVSGFLAAYGLHFLQLFLFTRDWGRAFYVLTERAVVRTVGENPYALSCDTSSPPILILKYLNLQSTPGIKIPLVWMFSAYLLGIAPLIPLRPGKKIACGILLVSGLLILLSFGIDWFAGRPGLGISQLLLLSVGVSLSIYGITALVRPAIPNKEKLLPLAIATTWALLSSFTWVFLARNHMECHLHLNAIVFYLPFGITLFFFVGFWLQGLLTLGIRRVKGGRSG